MYPYFCVVKVNGTIVDPYSLINYTEVNFTMTPIDRYSNGAIKWNNPVNLTFIKENWN
jgi:hypothetical protein